MNLHAELSVDGGTLLVRIPIKRRQRGGHRLMVATAQPAPAVDDESRIRLDPILKALGRAWRWKRLLDSVSLNDLAAAEQVSKSYLCRLLRLTLLPPAVIEAILDGTLRHDLLLADLIAAVETDWTRQASQMAGT